MRKFAIPAAFAVIFAVSGCVASDVERAGVGALAGGLGALALDGNIGTGLLIGGAAGALCDDVNVC